MMAGWRMAAREGRLRAADALFDDVSHNHEANDAREQPPSRISLPAIGQNYRGGQTDHDRHSNQKVETSYRHRIAMLKQYSMRTVSANSHVRIYAFTT
jgi:hypothetical protein